MLNQRKGKFTKEVPGVIKEYIMSKTYFIGESRGGKNGGSEYSDRGR
jgi:hypothetical protein